MTCLRVCAFTGGCVIFVHGGTNCIDRTISFPLMGQSNTQRDCDIADRADGKARHSTGVKQVHQNAAEQWIAPEENKRACKITATR